MNPTPHAARLAKPLPKASITASATASITDSIEASIKVLAATLTVASIALLGACAKDKTPEPAVAPRLIERPAGPTLALTDTDVGAQVVLERTQTLVVGLRVEGSQSPEWSLPEPKPSLMSVIDSTFVRAARDIDAGEAAGSTVFRLRPNAPGRLTLTFELRRLHSTEPPLRTVSFDVTVK